MTRISRKSCLLILGVAILLLSLMVSFSTEAAAATPRNPDYGIWGIWGLPSASEFSKYPFLKGYLVTVDWSMIEPSDNNFNWTKFDERINRVLNAGIRAGFMVYHGSKTPEWVYSQGVEKIGNYPLYTDPDFMPLLQDMVVKVKNHVMANPKHNKIGYMQCPVGRSGDEVPGYSWNSSQWGSWEDWMKDVFILCTNTYAGTGIKPMFNYASGAIASNANNYPGAVDSDLNWLNNINPNAYMKQGRPAHRFDMPLEKYQTEYALTRLRPQNKFTRGEQDHYSGGSLTGINGNEMVTNMYWNALWALTVGIGQWNITPGTSQLQPIENHFEAFNFFNKYAGYNDGAAVPGAFIAMRDGLDAADTNRFPESQYGKADVSSSGSMSDTANNRNRFANILSAFVPYGAKQDDPANQFKSQVQYYFINGFNDVKFSTYTSDSRTVGSGNYENFMTMINPLGTSQGRWRVGPVSHPYHRYGRQFNNARNPMRFQLEQRFASSLSGSVYVTVKWYDQGTGRWRLTYDAVGNSNKTVFEVTNTNSNNWRSKTVEPPINDYAFDRRGPNNSDLGLEYVSGGNTIFHMIEVERTGSQEPTVTPLPGCAGPGDIDCDQDVDADDMRLVLKAWGRNLTSREDAHPDGKVNLYDAAVVVGNWAP